MMKEVLYSNFQSLYSFLDVNGNFFQPVQSPFTLFKYRDARMVPFYKSYLKRFEGFIELVIKRTINKEIKENLEEILKIIRKLYKRPSQKLQNEFF